MAQIQFRRLRQNALLRELTREVRLTPAQFIQPLFVVEGLRSAESIPGLSENSRETPDTLLKRVEKDLELGVSKFLLFGVPAHKTENQFNFDFTSKQIQSLKSRFGGDLLLFVDVCLCSYTSHGHCGILSAEGDHVENEASVEALAHAAGEYAQAGADGVAPSDMMDGRVAAIRGELLRRQKDQTVLMSYSAKFHSKFYGPFRVAANSAPQAGTEARLKDRASYQIDPGRFQDALLSSERDAHEGADILMVKPGLPYLDVLQRLSSSIALPWAVYEVSGEYAAIEALAEKGLISAPEAHVEAWTSFARAGASIIISYGARKAAQWLK